MTVGLPRDARSVRVVDLRTRPAVDPVLEGAMHVLSVPLRHVYAALWRAGVLHIRS